MTYRHTSELARMDTYLRAIRTENLTFSPGLAESIEEDGIMVTRTTDQLNEAIRAKAVLASMGMDTTSIDSKIAEFSAQAAAEHVREEAAAGYDFAVEVEGATEEAIKDRAASEGPFVQPSTPGAFIGEIWKIELDGEMRGKDVPVFKINWRSLDEREPTCRGTLFCEMKDNAEWVLTRNVLGNLGIPYDVQGNQILFHDFTVHGTEPFPCQAVWARAERGKATFKIEQFLTLNTKGPEPAI